MDRDSNPNKLVNTAHEVRGIKLKQKGKDEKIKFFTPSKKGDNK